MADVAQAAAHTASQGFRWKSVGVGTGRQAEDEDQYSNHAQGDYQEHGGAAPPYDQRPGQGRSQGTSGVDRNATEGNRRRHLLTRQDTNHRHHPGRHPQGATGAQDEGAQQQ
ncbi:hypothetical protein D9M71_370840 [compost metagenome]